MSYSGFLFVCLFLFFISSISFRFFLRISISLFPLPICYCMLCTLSVRALSMLITIILNAQSDRSSIPAMSGNEACSVFSDCVFCLFYDLHFFFFSLDRGIMYWVKETAINRLQVTCC